MEKYFNIHRKVFLCTEIKIEIIMSIATKYKKFCIVCSRSSVYVPIYKTIQRSLKYKNKN